MIKAETITHEGSIGPSWLDKCRSAITPLSTTVALLLVGVLGGSLIAVVNHSGSTAPATNSQPAAGSNNLEVSPVSGTGQTAQSDIDSSAAVSASTTPLQSPNNSQQATNQSSTSASSPLNGLTGGTTPTNNNASGFPLLQSSGNGQTQSVQSTLQGSSANFSNAAAGL